MYVKGIRFTNFQMCSIVGDSKIALGREKNRYKENDAGCSDRTLEILWQQSFQLFTINHKCKCSRIQLINIYWPLEPALNVYKYYRQKSKYPNTTDAMKLSAN